MPNLGRKILTVCAEGNNRSVVLAAMLKAHGHEAIACGVTNTSEEAFTMLCGWADHVIVVDAHLMKAFADPRYLKFMGKVLTWDVGPDRYFLGYAPDLVAQYRTFMSEYAGIEVNQAWVDASRPAWL